MYEIKIAAMNGAKTPNKFAIQFPIPEKLSKNL